MPDPATAYRPLGRAGAPWAAGLRFHQARELPERLAARAVHRVDAVDIVSAAVDEHDRLLELNGGGIADDGVGLGDDHAVIRHVDRGAQLPVVRLEDVELAPGHSRIVIAIGMETNLAGFAQLRRGLLDDLLVGAPPPG